MKLDGSLSYSSTSTCIGSLNRRKKVNDFSINVNLRLSINLECNHRRYFQGNMENSKNMKCFTASWGNTLLPLLEVHQV